MIDPSAASIVRGLVPLFGIASLGTDPRVFIFRKRAAPTVGEIKDRHVKHEYGVVPPCAWSKEFAGLTSEIVFTWFCFHCDFRMTETLSGRQPVTTKQSWDLLLPLSGEDVRVAKSADGCKMGRQR